MSPRRHALTVPALAVLLAALTACGSAATGEPAAAPSASEAAPSATATTAPELSKEEFVQRIVDAALAAGSYDMSMVMQSAGETMRLDGSMHFGDVPSLSMSMQVPGSDPMDMISSGGIWYVNFGETSEGKFLEIDPSDTSNPFASMFGEVQEQMDPTAALEEQQAAIVSVTPDGAPTEVDGVEVQRYVVVMDTAQIPDLEAELPAGTTLPETLDYVYLVDADGHMREVSFEIMGATSTLSMSNWGSAAPVVAPTADQITSTDALGF